MRKYNLYGIILMGGQSSRFGSPKGNIHIKDTPQWMQLFGMLEPFCKDVFFSIHPSLRGVYPDIPDNKILYDEVVDQIGPMGGLYTALEHIATTCLFLSIDWFMMEQDTIEYLCEQHNREFDMTAYIFEKIQILCAIYEPSIIPYLKDSIARQEYSMYQLLLHSNIKSNLIDPLDDAMRKSLTRVNEKKDLELLL